MTNAHTARAWLLARARRRRDGRRQALRRRLDQRGRGREVRHRHRQHVRVLGLGRRPLLDGLGDRPLDDDRDRPGRTSARCWPASTRWTSTSAPRRSSATCRCCMGLLAVWYNDFFGAQTVAVLPYEQYLKRFPAYLQQLTMESNGKHVTLDGARGRRTRPGPIYWGEPGTNGQHSFYQLIHQGTRLIPLRLHRVRRRRSTRSGDHHDMLHRQRLRARRGARVRQDARGSEGRRHARLARAAPRLRRQPPVEHDPARQKLTPAALGKLSRSTSTACSRRASIWHIDSFDQWGVELGKVLAQRIIPELDPQPRPAARRTTARPTP